MDIIDIKKFRDENKGMILEEFMMKLVKETQKEFMRKELNECMSLVNKRLHDDEFGSYEWNEILMEELEERGFYL